MRMVFGKSMGWVIGVMSSEVELNRKLNQTRITGCRDDASEIAGVNDPSRIRVDTASRRCDHVEIANRIIEIDVVEKIEELSTELNVFLFAQREAFDNGKVDVELSWTT